MIPPTIFTIIGLLRSRQYSIYFVARVWEVRTSNLAIIEFILSNKWPCNISMPAIVVQVEVMLQFELRMGRWASVTLI